MKTFEDLKVGDLVLITNRIKEELVPIERITKTMIITKYQRFNIKNGELCNSGIWNDCKIRIPTSSEIESIIYKNKISKIKSLIISKLNYCSNLEKLEKIKSILGEKV